MSTCDPYLHPLFCPGEGCGDDPSEDILHREGVQAMVVPASDRDTPVTFELVRCDELDGEGRQVVHEPEGLVTLGGTVAAMTAAELDVVAVEASMLAHRVRFHAEQPPTRRPAPRPPRP